MTTQTPILTSKSIGKYYKTRNGGKTEIDGYNPDNRIYLYKDKYGIVYSPDGRFIYGQSHPLDIVAEWVDEPKLVPLPKEMPTDWHNLFADLIHNRMSPSAFYKKISETYGTPASKPELPSVEELAKELIQVTSTTTSKTIAKYIIDNYSLHHREWWMDLKKGDKLKHEDGSVHIYDGIFYLVTNTNTNSFDYSWIDVTRCSPYTEPTPSEKFIASLTDEQKQLLKNIDDKLEMLNKI